VHCCYYYDSPVVESLQIRPRNVSEARRIENAYTKVPDDIVREIQSAPTVEDIPRLGKTTATLVNAWLSAPLARSREAGLIEFARRRGANERARRMTLVQKYNFLHGGKKVVDYTDDQCVTLMGAIILYHIDQDKT
jgi:hypothetical protein